MENEIQFRVQWGDTDAAGIVFYPNFLKWFDWGTWNLLAAAGLTLDVIESDYQLIGFPIVEAQSRFHSPVRFWDEVHLTSRVDEWGRKSFRVAHTLRRNGAVSAEGTETRVCARADAGTEAGIRAVSVPPEIRRRLAT